MFGKLFAASLLVLTFLANGPASAGPHPGTFPNGMCWNVKVVDVHFNPSLAVELENPNNRVQPFPSNGSVADRKTAMQQAIDDWNIALKAIGANVSLKMVITKSFAGRQGPVKCTDPDFRNESVFSVDYARHYNDGDSVGSTAEPNVSGRKGLGAGWITGGNVRSSEIDQRLAETGLVPRPNDDAKEIREADIIWFTHFSEGQNRCPAIRWNYVATPKPAAAPFYDYYSVMLHEVGHLLGLDHQDLKCGMPGPGGMKNVMHSMLMPGERTGIFQCELDALKALYGPKAECANPKKPI